MAHSTRVRRQRFWRFHPLGRALQMGAVSFIGGAWTGALVGYSNSFSNPPGVGPSVAQWVAFTAFANGLWSLALGLPLGLLLFVSVGIIESQWKAPRRWRFARALAWQMFAPVLVSLFLSPLLAAPWLIAALQRGGDLGNVLGAANICVLVVASLLFVCIPLLSSRRARRARPRVSLRLLSLD